MSTVVTLHVFSGLPNPTWVLDNGQADQLMERIGAANVLTYSKPKGAGGRLGYSGFSISRSSESPAGELDLFIHEGIIDKGPKEANLMAGNLQAEEWLLDTARGRVADEVIAHVRSELRRSEAAPKSFALPDASGCPTCVAADAPLYNPNIWNFPNVQPYNNCYNYANDHQTNTFAQPGRAHGKPITSLNCVGVQPSAQADGLNTCPDFSTSLGSGQGWYVALVIWPGQDYHWYRQDNIGCWSHKPGQTAVRNYDNSGKSIPDPKTCDRGPYTVFCTYMMTNKNVVIQ